MTGTGLLADKIALITGGGAGIGRGIVTRFLAEGAKVVVAEYDEERCSTLRDDYAGNDSLHVVRTDVREKEQVLAAVQAAVDTFGGLDILVNNAFTLSPRVLLEHKTDDMLDGTLHAGLWAAWWGMQAARPIMAERGGGAVVNFYSIDVETAAWLNSDYVVTKSALLGLTRSSAHEWGRFGIRVNSIAPTAMGTHFHALAAEHPGFAEASAARKPLGRNGDPELDIAPVVVFLASEMSRFVTGELIHADGGLHMPGYDSRPADLGALGG
ncbi:SDR family oxidoreductase [Janibacter terrae]|uniref:SDR family NAD(P)-dependent oxidoreductase n=1 Tax=Janibacter terrae TaxID=103817 RepID=UPI0031F9A911